MRGLFSNRHPQLLLLESELSMDRNRNLFRREYIDFLGTGAEMELFRGLQGTGIPVDCLKNVTELLS